VRIESRAGRTDFVRVRLQWRNGEAWATPAGAQVSGHVAPQSRAHALLVVDDAHSALDPGAAADALVLRLPGGA
jgi:molybdopterin biosynthesis enzyme